MKIDTEINSLLALFPKQHVFILKFCWADPYTFYTNRELYEAYLKETPEKMSRATLINAADDLYKLGLLDAEHDTGKGGRHRKYRSNLNTDDFKKLVLDTFDKWYIQTFETLEWWK